MDAVVMTGGKGSRLLPYTEHIPKGMMPVGGVPLLGHILHQLKHAGFTRVTLACGYLAQLIQAYFQDGSQWGVDLHYFVEQQPLGTIGAIKQLPALTDSFLVINCDVLTSLNLREFAAFHQAGKSALTVASQARKVKLQLGVLEVKDDQVIGFAEKPNHSVRVSMGIYMMQNRVLDLIPANQFFDVPDLIQTLLAQQWPIRHYANDAYWLDVGTHADYLQACTEYEQMRSWLYPGDAHDD